MIDVWMKQQGITMSPGGSSSSTEMPLIWQPPLEVKKGEGTLGGEGENEEEDSKLLEGKNGDEEVESKVSKKIELPTFDGTDPTGWIGRVEKFFEVHHVESEEKVHSAFVSMDGPVVHWFRFLRKKILTLTWEVLTSEMIKRYCGRKAINTYKQLAAMKQEGSIEEYVHQFEVLVAQMEDMPEIQDLG